MFLAISTLRPDILLFSMSTKKVIIIELICPYEENLSQWHEEKPQKYYQLCFSIRSKAGLFISMLKRLVIRVFVLSQKLFL